jgi:uridylate kinase
LATVINALALQSGLEKLGSPARVMTAIEMRGVAETFVASRAIRHMEKGRVVIFGAGTGSPFFSTDTAAALRACEIKSDCLLKATKVDGIYDKDPAKFADAKPLPEATYEEALAKDLKVMDAAAFALCRDNKIPIVVFDGRRAGSLKRLLVDGERIGSTVKA